MSRYGMFLHEAGIHTPDELPPKPEGFRCEVDGCTDMVYSAFMDQWACSHCESQFEAGFNGEVL